MPTTRLSSESARLLAREPGKHRAETPSHRELEAFLELCHVTGDVEGVELVAAWLERQDADALAFLREIMGGFRGDGGD